MKEPSVEPRAASGHRGISRVDNEPRGLHGWYVRVRFEGKTRSRWVGDVTHGGRARGLQFAIRERNRLEKEAGRPRTERVIGGTRTRSEVGVSGVRKSEKKGVLVYEVSWSPLPGKAARTTISIRKWGEKEALRRAIAIRREKERELYGGVVSKASGGEERGQNDVGPKRERGKSVKTTLPKSAPFGNTILPPL